jgi:carboxyl-terminal processing protease
MENKYIGRKQVLVIFGFFVAAVLLFLSGYYLGAGNIPLSSADQNKTQLTNTSSSYKTIDVNLLWTVWDKINTDYLKKDVDNKALFYDSIKGLVSGLDDPYTNFLTPSEVADYKKSNKGEFEGIGVTLRQDNQYTVIESVVDGFPASKKGLLSKDLILKVDGNSVESKSVTEVASLIRGTAGTTVKLAVYREATAENFEVEITREKIDIDNITLGEIKDGILTVKIYKFTEETPEAFTKMWDATVLKIQALNPKGIIIDLRGNPGGYVSGVEYILGDFVSNGKVIFYEEDRSGNRTQHVVNRQGKFLNIPLVVLVNQGSASASEIMAGALQDLKRAPLVGEKTVGKGVEQKLIDFTDGSQLQLVFNKWLTPNGNNIDSKNPLTPDYVIEKYKDQEDKAIELLKAKI